ncbi:MAG: site-specific integrase [Lachnoanaerobaculum sp.]|uniref:tyrosine-type recombinase/integrase n=1 Tax=Lachnoanaerobaculum sp. TaxID=2049030 RepID=UPI0025C3FFCF|nr:site-specific integrase [Lachnoanaerobaculum sp.]MBS5881815.1 site-specific integrase [Lachnoanaerobaculum sp.]
MAGKRKRIPRYGTVTIRGDVFYRTYVEDADGKKIALYSKSREALYEKEMDALDHIDAITLNRKSPTVTEYCEKWLIMQAAHVRETTMVDHTSKVRRHIEAELGDMKMTEMTLDDIQLAMVSVSEKSASVYKSITVLYKQIFKAVLESRVIDKDPTIFLSARSGGIPQEDKKALTDEQVEKLLAAVEGLQTHIFIMLGLYAGLRREEILALQWDAVFLDDEAPYLTVKRAWHTENNRPVILDELKTKSSRRNIPLPDPLLECLKDMKKASTSDYVICNSSGGPLSYSQYKYLWKYVQTRTAETKTYTKYENGKRVTRTFEAKLGEKARNNGHVHYTLDFKVTPHQLRHTYITNLIRADVDPKTVQYLARHFRSKITMDIYAKVKYNRPDDVVKKLGDVFGKWDSEE